MQIGCCAFLNYQSVCICNSSWNHVVSVVTAYRLDGLGIESWWGEISHALQTDSKGHQALCTLGTGSALGLRWLEHGENG